MKSRKLVLALGLVALLLITSSVTGCGLTSPPETPSPPETHPPANSTEGIEKPSEDVPGKTLTEAEKQEFIDIAKADPRIQELLDQGASIGEVFAMGPVEDGMIKRASVEIRLGEKIWFAQVDLTEGKVMRLEEPKVTGEL